MAKGVSAGVVLGALGLVGGGFFLWEKYGNSQPLVLLAKNTATVPAAASAALPAPSVSDPLPVMESPVFMAGWGEDEFLGESSWN